MACVRSEVADAVACVVHLPALPSQLEVKVQVSASSQMLGGYNEVSHHVGLMGETVVQQQALLKPLHIQLAKQTPAC